MSTHSDREEGSPLTRFNTAMATLVVIALFIYVLVTTASLLGFHLTRKQRAPTGVSLSNAPAPAARSLSESTNLTEQTGTEVVQKIQGNLGYLTFFRTPNGSRIPATNWTIISQQFSLFESRTAREVISFSTETGMLDGKVTTVGIYFVHKPRAESVPKKDPLWRPNSNPEVK